MRTHNFLKSKLSRGLNVIVILGFKMSDEEHCFCYQPEHPTVFWAHFSSLWWLTTCVEKKKVLDLNVNLSKEISIDFRKTTPYSFPPLTNNTAVEMVKSARFMVMHITNLLFWLIDAMSLVKRAQQRLHFLLNIREISLCPHSASKFHPNLHNEQSNFEWQ